MSTRNGTALPDIHRIVVLRPNAVGDFIYALPALHALRASYPDAQITYIGRTWHADFLRGRPGPIDRVEVLPPCPGLGLPAQEQVDTAAVETFVARMQAQRFDLALQMYGGGRYSNPFIKRFGARLTIGLKADDAEPLDRWLHYGPLQQRRLQLLELVALAGAQAPTPHPELEVIESDREEADAVLRWEAQRPLVLLQPGVSDARRRWAAAHFARVGDALVRAGARVAVNGTEQEREVVRAVLAQMHEPAHDLSGALSLSGLCGLLARSALLISNDTGPLHLALALGTPCVGIYWLSNLFEAAPLRQRDHRALLATRTACPVCGVENLRQRCAHDVSFVDEVAVEEVLAQALALLAGPLGAPPPSASRTP